MFLPSTRFTHRVHGCEDGTPIAWHSLDRCFMFGILSNEKQQMSPHLARLGEDIQSRDQPVDDCCHGSCELKNSLGRHGLAERLSGDCVHVRLNTEIDQRLFT